MNDELRTTSNDPRATTCVRRVTSRWAASGGVGRPSARRQATRAGRRASSGGRRFAGNEQRRRRAKNCRPRGLQTQVTCSGLTSRWCRPQSGCGGSHDPLNAAAHRRAVRPQSDEATGDNRVHSGARLGPADNEQRATNNERRVTGSVMRATSDEQRTTSGDLRVAGVVGCVGLRAAASGDKAPDDKRRATGHALRATTCVRRRVTSCGQRTTARGRRATQAASDEPWATRLANPGDLLRSNKPMMLAATGVRWIARPAHCGSISASRWAASDGGGVGGRQELGGWTAAAGGERRQRATSDVRKSTNWANERRSTNNEVASDEWRATSDEWRATATSNEVASDELRATRRRATAASGVAAGCGRRATGSVARSCGPLGRAQQADGADRNRGAVDRTTRCGGSTSASRWAASDEQRATSGKANCGPVVTSVGRFM